MSKKNPGGQRTIRRIQKAIARSGLTAEAFIGNSSGVQPLDDDSVNVTVQWFLQFRRSKRRAYRHRMPPYVIARAEAELRQRRRRTYPRTKSEDRAHRPSRAMSRH